MLKLDAEVVVAPNAENIQKIKSKATRIFQ